MSRYEIDMSTLPLRAVILDNDETTGSYGILFAILHHLREQEGLTSEYIQRTLKRLAYWMMSHGLFRPGLRKLLSVLINLRNVGALDAIIMYTNQSEVIPPKGVHEFLYSPPKCIQYMFSYLMTQQVFDHMLTRPNHGKSLPGGWHVKQFKRVLDLYPDKPLNMSGLLFLDDLAQQPYIHTTGIPKSGVFQSSYFRVTPYKRFLSAKDVFECLLHVFTVDNMTHEFMDDVYKTYITTYAPNESSTPNGYMLMLASEQIQKKYGFISEKLQPMFLQKQCLNPLQSSEIDNDGVNKSSEINEGTSE